MVLDDETASDLFDHGGKHVLSDVDKIVVVSVGHVELTSGVFGVVCLVNRLVSKVFTNLEYSFYSADYTLLQE